MFEPTSDARQGAAALWDQYQAMLLAGFTPDQALQIIIAMVQATVSRGNSQN